MLKNARYCTWLTISRPALAIVETYYDAAAAKWHQLWIDNQVQNLRMSCGLEDDKMVPRSEYTATGVTDSLLNRITVTPMGLNHIRQHWKSRSVDTIAWKTLFDFDYQHINE